MSEDLDELRAWTVRVESDVADLSLALLQLREELSDAVAGGAVKAPAPSAAEVERWMTEVFAPTFARHVGPRFRWCPQALEHPEALLRLTALCAAYREAQQTGRWLPWLRDADASLTILSASDGSFAACTAEAHRPPDPLPTTHQETS